jgi:hypothetical protein
MLALYLLGPNVKRELDVYWAKIKKTRLNDYKQTQG